MEIEESSSSDKSDKSTEISYDQYIDEDGVEIVSNVEELEIVSNVEENIEGEVVSEETLKEPEVGMIFDTVDGLLSYYSTYGNQKGFPVKRRSSKKGENGEVRWVIYACSRSGKTRSNSKNSFKMHPITKTECRAQIIGILCHDGKWRLTKVFLDHNHGLSPGKSRYFNKNRVLRPYVKRRLEMNDRAGIRPNKNYGAILAEAGGPENLSFLEKDCYNHLNRLKRWRLKEGDAAAIQSYFSGMQENNSNFYSLMDLDTKGRIKNLFWADARSRAAYEEFGDVITFDTTYLTNKYDMPFAPFVGVNHHGQSILLGCALLSNEKTETFIWVFRTWLACMGGCAPIGIITDQDRAMQNAIEIVFPATRHRWCMWHIMKKMPENLPAKDKRYESMKFAMQRVVYDSLSIEEFETSWSKFVEKFDLGKNTWLTRLYNERHRWVPVFVKDVFWAGMSTTQRSESMNSYFDGYVHSNTTLKLFAEQYENALRSKVEKENLEDYYSFNSRIPCITRYEMEKQFQSAYTTTKFKEVQAELTGKIYCEVYESKEKEEYRVVEHMVGDSNRQATFIVNFDPAGCDIKCNCRLFEFRGILCRHAIAVLLREKVQIVPEKYILRRWRKDIKRCHTKVKVTYSNWMENPENERFDRMCNAFYQVADLATDVEAKTNLVMEWMKRLTIELNETESERAPENNEPTSLPMNTPSVPVDNDPIREEIHSPLVVSRKGRRAYKRKKSSVEEAIEKENAKTNKKIIRQSTKRDVTINQNLDKDPNGKAQAVEIVGTQESRTVGSIKEINNRTLVPNEGISSHHNHPMRDNPCSTFFGGEFYTQEIGILSHVQHEGNISHHSNLTGLVPSSTIFNRGGISRTQGQYNASSQMMLKQPLTMGAVRPPPLGRSSSTNPMMFDQLPKDGAFQPHGQANSSSRVVFREPSTTGNGTISPPLRRQVRSSPSAIILNEPLQREAIQPQRMGQANPSSTRRILNEQPAMGPLQSLLMGHFPTELCDDVILEPLGSFSSKYDEAF